MTTLTAPAELTLPNGSSAASGWSLSATGLHVNHGSFGAVPVATQVLQNTLRARMDADPVAWFSTLPERVGAVRREIAGFVGSDPDTTALVPNASAGASVVYSSLPVTRDREIVVTDHGYGAVTMGAERLARRWGGTVRTAHVPLGATPQEAHDAVMDECTSRTRLIVIDHITSATARLLPVREISASARERGIVTLVDGAHVPGLYADPLRDLDCDFWVGNLHKFACGPRGTAVLVAPGELSDELYPLIDSWGAPLGFPERFDSQGTLDLTSYLAAPKSFEFIETNWGWDTARIYMSRLADYAESVIATAFSEETGEDHHVDVGSSVNALRLVRLPSGLAKSHAEADALRDLVVAQFGIEAAFTSFEGVGYYRLSTHVYNTASDFDSFVERLVPLLIEWGRAAQSARP
ncbi:isopenicillin-N epimerase [Okibacterium sp. HSC-33S16]|uniref:aminotransferase class V-fold PLP-dependent enzyme n=1 Tax=Okibacterium sp. HSC-33S16 TaxID=2910965 RepID=UPI00209C99EB|nr:aminotransferase class V-fold PLP-dependent enzyme [Okibacterium sp. HSC-33S16]MCP2031480.1 isopenicillin-N epimerase [Okibacterium sp. HSC-33S16]